jgi:hypothetical protein
MREWTSVSELIPILQTAIGPMILISGVGLLLLTMTNRLGRAIDRARLLVVEYAQASHLTRAPIEAQLRILYRRARSIRLAIALSSISALTAAILIILLFVTALWGIEIGWLIVVTFILCLGSLIASLALFIHDINRSLAALKLEFESTGIES